MLAHQSSGRKYVAPAVMTVLTTILLIWASLWSIYQWSLGSMNDEMLAAYIPTDVVSLLLGAPMLLFCVIAAWRGKWLGLLLWPGVLFFVLYCQLPYILGHGISLGLLLHGLIAALCVYTLILLLPELDADVIRQRLEGEIPLTWTILVLVGMGGAFFLLAVGTLAQALFMQTHLAQADVALQMTDALTAPAWVIGGILLWRHNRWGYVIGLGLLLQACMLFVGLIIHMLLQPLLAGTPIAWADVLVVALMSLVSVVPFVRYARRMGWGEI